VSHEPRRVRAGRGADFGRAKCEIVRQGGRQFDPQAVDGVLREEAVLREMVALGCSDPRRGGGLTQPSPISAPAPCPEVAKDD
jgi:hypothetical protein